MKVQRGTPQDQTADMRPQPPGSRGDQPPAGVKLWLTAVRPRTLTIALAPVVAGAAWGWAEFSAFQIAPVLVALIGALLIQAGTNLWNDVGDALRGGDQPMRQGPPRVTAMGWAGPERVRRAAAIAFAGAVACGLYLVWVGGWPIALLGLASLAAGWGYSGGKRPISYTAWGEVCVVAFFGIGAVCGTVWLSAGDLSWRSLLVGTAVGLPAAGVLMANNFRDLEHDRMVGRRTLAIRLGADGARLAYGVFVLGPFVLLTAPFMPAGAWVAAPAAILALRLTIAFATTPRGPDFNKILAGTAQYQLALCGLFAAGMLL